MKKVIKIIKRIILAFVLLYSYNLIAVSYNLMIPINIYTVLILTFLDGPGLLLLALILKVFYWG
jgi:pro-sigmaK processing inhibitor BofA